MDFMRVCGTFLLCRGLQQRAAHSSINHIDVSDIHWGCGGQVSVGRVGSRAFGYLNLPSESMKSFGAGRDRGKARHPRR